MANDTGGQSPASIGRAESLLVAAKRTSEMIAAGAPLPEILANLCGTIDAQSPDIISTILLWDPDSQRLRSAAGSRVPAGSPCERELDGTEKPPRDMGTANAAR